MNKYETTENHITLSNIARRYGMNTEELYVILDHDAEAKRRGLTPLLPEPFLMHGVKCYSELDLEFILKR